MTKKAFKKSMQCGLGRCILELNETSNIEKYYDLVLWGCTHNFSYDTQSEGSRSWYMYELIKRFPKKTAFLEAICQCFEKSTPYQYWKFHHFCSLLVLFAIDGSQLAENTLWKVYQELYQTLYHRKRAPRTSFEEAENFECLCIELIGLEGQCGDIWLKIVEDIGNLYLHSPIFKNWFYTFEWFDDHCKQLYGKRHIKKILKNKAEKSPAIERYMVQSEQFQEEQADSFRRYQECQKPEPQSAIEIYQFLKERVEKNPGTYFQARRFINNGKISELKQLNQMYMKEKNLELRQKLLWIFACKKCAFLLDPETVVNDTKSENKVLSDTAFYALQYICHEKVRNYALELMKKGGDNEKIIYILASNYRKEDRDIFVDMVKSIPVVYHGDTVWHGVFSTVLDMFENSSVKNPPKELLLYMYENTQCSCCRSYIVTQMGRRRMLTEDIITECLYDCNEDIRSYAKKKKRKLHSCLSTDL